MKQEENRCTLSLKKQIFFVRWSSKAFQYIFLGLLFVYQKAVSPLLPSTCRYFPSCSSYAFTAVKRFGPFHGGFLALKRVLRCHPFHEGGYDPVPHLIERKR